MKRQVDNAADAGDGDVEARTLRRRMQADPENLTVRLQLARHYDENGFPEVAAEHYRLAAAHFPDSAEVVVALAKSLRAMDLTSEAIAILEKFESSHPKTPVEVLSWLGLLGDESGDLKKAETSFRAAIRVSPNSDVLHNNLGYNLLLQGQMDQAAVEFRNALVLAPHSQVARNNLGIALASNPTSVNSREAILNWESVSDPATAHNNLAAVLIEKGRYADARNELAVALGYRKDLPAVLSNLQLVSELDGQPSTVSLLSRQTRWRRFAAGLRKAFVGVEEPKRDGAAASTATSTTASK
jgi:Flp pilus assembly protein TadD